MTKKNAENSQKAAKKRGDGRPFKPGQSGNPGGRPKLPPEIVELRALARQHTTEAVQAIIAVMNDEEAPSSARVSAASEVLDRGWGRATATVEANVAHHHTHESVSDTARWIEGLLGIREDEPAANPVSH